MNSKYDKLIRNNSPGGKDVWFILPYSEPYFNSRVDHEGTRDNSVRVFKSPPDSMTLQIRTYGKVTDNSRGTPYPVFSSFTSNRQNMLYIAAEIKRMAEELPEA